MAEMYSTCLCSHTKMQVVGCRQNSVPGKRQLMVKSDKGEERASGAVPLQQMGRAAGDSL